MTKRALEKWADEHFSDLNKRAVELSNEVDELRRQFLPPDQHYPLVSWGTYGNVCGRPSLPSLSLVNEIMQYLGLEIKHDEAKTYLVKKGKGDGKK